MHPGSRCGSLTGVGRGTVPRFVEADAGPGQAGADRRAHLAIIFANAAGKDDQIDPIESGDHRGDLLAHGIAEHIDRQVVRLRLDEAASWRRRMSLPIPEIPIRPDR